MARTCGNCGSSDIKAASAVAEQFHINTKATVIGGGFFGGSGGVGAAVSRGSTSPEVLKKIKLEVPHRAGFFSILLWIVLTFVFASLYTGDPEDTVAMWLFLLSFLTLIVKIVRIFTYPKRRRHYQRTWYCFSCGQFRIFES